MACSDEFVAHVLDLMRPWARPEALRAQVMFGGYGIARASLNFAIAAHDALFFKTDAQTQAQFVQAGSRPLEYTARGRQVRLNYWSAPEACLENAEAMAQWCALAWGAALRADARKKRKTNPPSNSGT